MEGPLVDIELMGAHVRNRWPPLDGIHVDFGQFCEEGSGEFYNEWYGRLGEMDDWFMSTRFLI